jgi:hypothetical protein
VAAIAFGFQLSGAKFAEPWCESITTTYCRKMAGFGGEMAEVWSPHGQTRALGDILGFCVSTGEGGEEATLLTEPVIL